MATAIVLCNAGSVEVHYNVKSVASDESGKDIIVAKRTHKNMGELSEGFNLKNIESIARKAVGGTSLDGCSYFSTGAEPSAAGVTILGEFSPKASPVLPTKPARAG